MLFEKANCSYYGQDTYKNVEKLIRSEQNILIVSPYIDDYYARYLVNHARGKSIHILSSSVKRSAAKKLGSGKPREAIYFVFLVAFFNILFLSIKILEIYFVTVSFTIAFLWLLYSVLDKRKIYLREPKEFVHVKLYIGDRAAIDGSANLTYAGMHKNVERINVTRDRARIAELKKQFWGMWNSP